MADPPHPNSSQLSRLDTGKELPVPQTLSTIPCVTLPVWSSQPLKLRSLHLDDRTGCIESAADCSTLTQSMTGSVPLVLPSLCHPHIHLDKPYLLTHPDVGDQQPEDSTLSEALKVTQSAKSRQEYVDSLMERGNQLLAASSRAGVTHIRAFVEVDATVGLQCLHAGFRLKEFWRDHLEVQICAFAQNPVKSGTDASDTLSLMEEAARIDGVDAIGSTPYVEEDAPLEQENVDWTIKLALQERKHLDFHLDYHLEAERHPLVWYVLRRLHEVEWATKAPGKTVCLGHCTALTQLSKAEWWDLLGLARNLPVYFIGLPTSDLYTAVDKSAAFDQGPPRGEGVGASMAALWDRRRGTLQIPAMIAMGFDCALGVNNVGNAFTPWGTADPLHLACLGVGIYQAGKLDDAIDLYGCVSWKAKEAIGAQWPLSQHELENRGGGDGRILPKDPADLVVFGTLERVPEDDSGKEGSDVRWHHRRFERQRRAVAAVVWDPPSVRSTIFRGRGVSLD